MEKKTFILTKTREFRFYTSIYLQGKEGKLDQRSITFTTERKVSEKQRHTNARKIAAEFCTEDEKIYDGMLRAHAYGKTWVLEDDPKGELKRDPIDITLLDAKKIALKNLFEAVDLEFDSTKQPEVLEQEYQIFVNAKTGSKVKTSGPAKIDHKEVDLNKQRAETINAAHALYKEKYGEDVPEAFANDTAFLSALANPEFDAKAYMAKNDIDSEEPTLEQLQKAYFEKKGVNPAPAYKNNAAWLKAKLAED